MDYYQILFVISNLVFISYNYIIYKRYGLLESISTSYCSLLNDKKLTPNYSFLFCLFCWFYAIPATMMASDGFMFFSFITFVGVASAFRENEFIAKIHQYSAITAVVLSQLSILFIYQMWYISVVFCIFAGIMFLLKNKITTWMYWLEMAAYFSIDIIIFKIAFIH